MLGVKSLVGRAIKRVFIGEKYLKFETDDGDVCYEVEGGCCSYSYFYDFIGADKVIDKVVTDFKRIDIDVGETDITTSEKEWGEEMKDKMANSTRILVYGYSITVEDPKFGELTAVFSFRNSSNGYYGGEMLDCHSVPADEKLTEVKTNYIP